MTLAANYKLYNE